MKKDRNELEIVYCIGAVFLLIATIFMPLGQSDFIIPPLSLSPDHLVSVSSAHRS